MCAPPYAPVIAEHQEKGLYPVIPAESKGLQPLAVCPALKGHLQFEGWMQDKNADLTDTDREVKRKEEEKLIELRRRADEEEERIKRLQAEMAAATEHYKNMEDAYDRTQEEKKALIDKVEGLKKQKKYNWNGEEEDEEEENKEGARSWYSEGGLEEVEPEREERKGEQVGCEEKKEGTGWEKRKGSTRRARYWKKLERGSKEKSVGEQRNR